MYVLVQSYIILRVYLLFLSFKFLQNVFILDLVNLHTANFIFLLPQNNANS
jgi:hypothetical protein